MTVFGQMWRESRRSSKAYRSFSSAWHRIRVLSTIYASRRQRKMIVRTCHPQVHEYTNAIRLFRVSLSWKEEKELSQTKKAQSSDYISHICLAVLLFVLHWSTCSPWETRLKVNSRIFAATEYCSASFFRIRSTRAGRFIQKRFSLETIPRGQPTGAVISYQMKRVISRVWRLRALDESHNEVCRSNCSKISLRSSTNRVVIWLRD